MKTHDFKTLCICFCFTIGILSLFLYAIIWLNKGYTMEDGMDQLRKEFNEKLIILDTNKLNKAEIMPSAMKGRK